MKKSCLWVLPKNIFPIRDGARVANSTLLKSMSGQFSNIEVAVFNELIEEIKDEKRYQNELGSEKIYFFTRSSFNNAFLKYFYYFLHILTSPLLPMTTSYFQTRDLNKLLKKNNYEFILFDCLHPFAGLTIWGNTKIIYRAHNVEQDLWSMAIAKTNNPLKKIVFWWQGQLMAKLENRMLKKAHIIWAISEEDKKRFLELAPNIRVELVPVSVNFQKRSVKRNKEKSQLLFLGKLDWPPNQEGLTWFLNEVWPAIDKTKFDLNIVGSGNGNWCQKYLSDTSIQLHGFVENIQDIYNEMDISIVPVHFGSGTRIKVIECVSRAMPMVSTAMGVQGSGLSENNYFLAETKEEWIEFFETFDLEVVQSRADQTYEKFLNLYASNQVAERAINSL